MKILVTGATGYIGQRIVAHLLQHNKDAEIYCLLRNKKRFSLPKALRTEEHRVKLLEGDLLKPESMEACPKDIQAAYFLVHSMSGYGDEFAENEAIMAENFNSYVANTDIEQVIYLGGIANSDNLSPHLKSRQYVEEVLNKGKFHLTVLRAAIIIGSGSASFEIIRDLVEKLPVMIAPKWLRTRCQPIGIVDVMRYLGGVLLKKEAYDKVFDIGGPDIMPYKDMLLRFAKFRKLNRFIIDVPFLTPRLSSYWLYYVTSISFQLAYHLVDSMKNEVVCLKRGITDIVPGKCMSYEESIQRAFYRIKQNEVVSSWTDSFNHGKFLQENLECIEVPTHGCFTDEKITQFDRPVDEVLENIWTIGGDNGWYYMDWAWDLRGIIDKMVGGVGMRRGRENQHELKVGEAIDFWRVILADKENKHLILFAEMKVPGEAWLEFAIFEASGRKFLMQKATFRPHGLLGRLYWYAVLPTHFFIFNGMLREIIRR